jgi:hypothetical protein
VSSLNGADAFIWEVIAAIDSSIFGAFLGLNKWQGCRVLWRVSKPDGCGETRRGRRLFLKF